MPKPRFSPTQGRYLAFLRAYAAVHGRAPSEAEMGDYFHVSPPSVHQMVLTLEKHGLIAREPGKARSIRVLVPAEALPPLDGAGPTAASRKSADAADTEVDRAAVIEETVRRVVQVILERALDIGIDESDSLPLIAAAADAAKTMAREAGVAPRDARALRERVLDAAEATYVRQCEASGEEGDSEEDAARFRELLTRRD